MVDEVKVEHVLMFVITAFLLYHLVGNCGCTNRGDGFSVGNQSTNDTCISQGTNSIPFNCDSASGIIKYNASKIVCPNNKCNFNTCCDKINTSCTQALNELCQYDLDAVFKSDCIQCVGHDNPLKLHKAGCLHNDLVDYCQDQPGRETRDLITPGFYKTGISMNDPSGWLPKLIGDFNICKSKPCPKGSAFYENTKEGCLFSTDIDKYLTPLIGPIVNNRNTCKLDKTIQSTDEVIDVRSLNLIPGVTDDGKHKVSPSYWKNGNNWEYYYPNLLSNPSIILDTDPKIKILNMLYENFNFIRIGVNKLGGGVQASDYMIVFKNKDGSTTKEGKHYNYTFIDNTGDNYDISTRYYGGDGKTLGYNSESPQINYIIKS